MKQLITFIAIFLLVAPMIIFNTNYKMALLATDVTKRDAKEASSTAILYYDEREYSYGKFVLKDNKIINYLDTSVGTEYTYTVYIYDEKERLRTYNNNNIDKRGSLVSDVYAPLNGSGKYTFTDIKGKSVEINGSCVVIILDNNTNHYKLPGLSGNTSVRSVMYAIQKY